MTFENLHGASGCDCISSAVENYTDTFSRRVSEKGNVLHKDNFKLSKANRDGIFDDCNRHCSAKSLSIDLFNDETRGFLQKKYNSAASIAIAPQFRSQLLIFRIKKDGALVKPSPSNKNPYHYSMYCPDGFDSTACLEPITTVKISYDDV